MAQRKAKKRELSGKQLLKLAERLDKDLVKLLNERVKLSKQLAKLAPENEAWAILDAQQTIARAISGNAGPISERSLRTVFRELLSDSRMLVDPVRVAFLGPKYSYCYLAAVERFGGAVELIPVSTIAAIFEEVQRGRVEYGLAPIENSTDGRVVDTLSMFSKMPLHISGEVQLRIHHILLAKCGRAEIREVYSKPQALSQCRNWLAKNLPTARLVEMTSTTAAAQLAAERQGAAAVASREAGRSYGLEVVSENIEDSVNNVTRFAVIGGESPKRTGKDKTSLMFQLEHQPGALADAMSVFKRNELNLTWIESFPIPGAGSEYLFFVEMVGHESEAKTKRALASLKRKTLRLNVLGSYPRAEPAD